MTDTFKSLTFEQPQRKVLDVIQPYLIFWGTRWKHDDVDKITAKFKEMCDPAGYLSGLAQYNKEKPIQANPLISKQDLKDPPNPLAKPSSISIEEEIQDLIDTGVVQFPPDPNCKLLVMLVLPDGITCKQMGCTGDMCSGEHSYFEYRKKSQEGRKVYYGWVQYGSIDRITPSLSEELVEAITDPEPFDGWVIRDTLGGELREICDVCGDLTYQLPGANKTLVKMYYSAKDQDAIAGQPAERSFSAGCS